MKARLTIKGERVQDVGYRLFLLERAKGLVGFEAHNVGRDLVVLIEGDETAVKNFVEFARAERPPTARVSEVRVEGYEGIVDRVENFRSNFMLWQMVKLTTVGVEMRDDIKVMLKKQDETIEEVRKVGVGVDKVKEEVSKVRVEVAKVKEGVDEVKEEVKHTREEVGKVREEVGKVKEEVGKVGAQVGGVKEEVGRVRDEVVKVKEEVGRTREEVRKVGTEVGEVKEEVGRTREEVKGLRQDLKSYMDERFRRLEEDVRMIKAKIGLE